MEPQLSVRSELRYEGSNPRAGGRQNLSRVTELLALDAAVVPPNLKGSVAEIPASEQPKAHCVAAATIAANEDRDGSIPPRGRNVGCSLPREVVLDVRPDPLGTRRACDKQEPDDNDCYSHLTPSPFQHAPGNCGIPIPRRTRPPRAPPETLLKLQTRRLDIEATEPPDYRVLDATCHDELLTALSRGPSAVHERRSLALQSAGSLRASADTCNLQPGPHGRYFLGGLDWHEPFFMVIGSHPFISIGSADALRRWRAPIQRAGKGTPVRWHLLAGGPRSGPRGA